MTNTQTSLTRTERPKPLVKIRHLDNFAELRANLIAISYLLGAKAPDEKVIVEMIGIIKDKFNFFTVQDITDAIKMGLAGKLTINGKILNLETYNNFSIPYVCKFFIAYREYLDNNNRLLPKLIESPEMTPKEEKQRTTSWLNNYVYPRIEKYFKTGEYDLPDYGNTLYNYLDKRKIINITLERKKEIKKQAREELLRELSIEKFSKPHERHRIGKVITDILEKERSIDGLIRTKAKKIVLKIFLENCKATNKDIISVIKEHEDL